jgi:hypothetical protein
MDSSLLRSPLFASIIVGFPNSILVNLDIRLGYNCFSEPFTDWSIRGTVLTFAWLNLLEKHIEPLISSKISSRPDWSGRSLCPVFFSASIRFRQRSLPSSQSKESVCRARRLGTSSGSVIRAKETRRGPGEVAEALREAANRGPSELEADG